MSAIFSSQTALSHFANETHLAQDMLEPSDKDPDEKCTLQTQAPIRIMMIWTNLLTNNSKQICYYNYSIYNNYPAYNNSIKIILSPHTLRAGILTVIIRNTHDNEVIVKNCAHECKEKTYTTRKNAVSFNYVLSYDEEYVVKARHVHFGYLPDKHIFRLVPSKTLTGWYVSYAL